MVYNVCICKPVVLSILNIHVVATVKLITMYLKRSKNY